MTWVLAHRCSLVMTFLRAVLNSDPGRCTTHGWTQDQPLPEWVCNVLHKYCSVMEYLLGVPAGGIWNSVTAVPLHSSDSS